MRFWYRVCYVLARIGLFFWHPVFRVHGRENVPEGAALLAANHASAADAVWVLLALNSPDMIRVMAKYELKHAFFIGWVMQKFNIIFVRRGQHDTAAYAQCVDALRGGEKLLMFIEGTRWRADRPTHAKTGAFRMAAETGAQVVPIYVTREKKPFGPIDVIFGEPFAVTCGADAPYSVLQGVAETTLYDIYRMGGDSYADHVGENGGLLLRS